MCFDTKIGLGLHARARHPNDFEETKSHTRIKTHWSEEELKVLALSELNLSTGANINQQLQSLFPARTVESIKCQRKSVRYKNLIEDLRGEICLNLGSPRRMLPTPSPSATTASPLARRLRRRLPPVSVPPSPLVAADNGDNQDDLIGFSKHGVFLRSLLEDTNACGDNRLKQMITTKAEGGDSFEEISQHFARKFTLLKTVNRRLGNSDTSRYARRAKLQRYARFQQMYNRNRKNLADMIINDKEDTTVFPTERSIRNVYQTLFESESPADNSPHFNTKHSVDVYYPVTLEELRSYLKSLAKSSPGSTTSLWLTSRT